MAPDFLTQKCNEIDARLRELRPLVDEYQRLQAAAAALAGAAAAGSSATPRSQRRTRAPATPPARQRAVPSRGAGTKGGSTRAAEALALVRASPGITIPEIARKMGIRQNYLYRVLPGLAEDGLVGQEGRGWKPKDAA